MVALGSWICSSEYDIGEKNNAVKLQWEYLKSQEKGVEC